MLITSCTSNERPIEDVTLEDQSLDIDGQSQGGNESDLSDSPSDSISTTEADLSDSSDIDTSIDSTSCDFSCDSSYRCPCDYDPFVDPYYCCSSNNVYECGQNDFWGQHLDIYCGDPEYPIVDGVEGVCPWVYLPCP